MMSDEITKEFRTDGTMGAGGKPLSDVADFGLSVGVSVPQAPNSYVDNMRDTICNAAGFFTFEKVADGEYFVQSNVTWTVGFSSQGGALIRRVTVAGGHAKEVTLAP
jgi:hypothetical protein